MEDLKEKLKNEIEQADWNMLVDHYEKKAVVLVDNSLELLDVAVAVAMDKTAMISLWLNDGQIKRSDDINITEFEKNPKKKMFNFVIIQPYVLVQIIKSESFH